MNNPSANRNHLPIGEAVGSDSENILFLPREMYDKALVGMCFLEGNRVAVYDKDKVIEILAQSFLSDPNYGESEDTAYEEASEYYYFNIEGSLGAGYPIYVSRQDLDVFLEDVEDVDKGSGDVEKEG